MKQLCLLIAVCLTAVLVIVPHAQQGAPAGAPGRGGARGAGPGGQPGGAGAGRGPIGGTLTPAVPTRAGGGGR